MISCTCERLASDACLEIRDDTGLVLWRQEVRQGDAATYCIRHEDATGGTISIRLRGNRDLLLVTGLIEEFHGSVYVKVFDERGNPLTLADL